jgi:hypothetical protein
MTEGLHGNPFTCGHCKGYIPNGGQSKFAPKAAEMKKWSNKADTEKTFAHIAHLVRSDIKREANAKKRSEPRPAKVVGKKRLLYEVSPVDVHVGKYAWSEEAGADYDIREAETSFTGAIDDLMEKAKPLPVEQIVLVVGNDLLQTDTTAGTTTAGTYVDTDSRIIKSFRRARAINSWAIREMAKVAPVRVVVVPGNHDELMAFCVGEVLAAEFDGDPRVTFDVSPRPRKYLLYGVNLIGWTHGNEEKIPDLPLLMATERKAEWSKSVHREWHIGHWHKAKEMRFTAGDSFNGVRVRVLPSLCAPDAWHARRGFVGERRACEAYLWDKERGYEGHFSSNILPATAA